MLNTEEDGVCVDVASVADMLPGDWKEDYIIYDYATLDTFNVRLSIEDCDLVIGYSNSNYKIISCWDVTAL